jgi:hypothetical protein
VCTICVHCFFRRSGSLLLWKFILPQTPDRTCYVVYHYHCFFVVHQELQVYILQHLLTICCQCVFHMVPSPEWLTLNQLADFIFALKFYNFLFSWYRIVTTFTYMSVLNFFISNYKTVSKSEAKEWLFSPEFWVILDNCIFFMQRYSDYPI